MERAAAIAGDDTAGIDAVGREQPVAGHVRRAHADHGDAQPVQVLAHDARGVQERGEQRGRAALLIVVPDRDIETRAQVVQDAETLGLRDVLEVDGAESGLEQCHRAHDLVGILRAETDGDGVDTAQVLEEQRLAFHHGEGRRRADVAQPEHARAVGDDGHRVRPVRVRPRRLGIARDEP
jgi:hypothetical protein